MTDIIFTVILAAILGSAAWYVYKAKKSGAKCIGCSVGEGGCGCGCGAKTEEASGCCCHTDVK